jgi:hypothetical protein
MRIVQHTLRSLPNPREMAPHFGWFVFSEEEAKLKRYSLTAEVVEYLENIKIIDIDADLLFTPKIRSISQPQEFQPMRMSCGCMLMKIIIISSCVKPSTTHMTRASC